MDVHQGDVALFKEDGEIVCVDAPSYAFREDSECEIQSDLF
jgi:hypothetical protein